jgi:molybdopterin converting factor subunit 1
MTTIKIKVLLFAHFADVAGSNRLELELDEPANVLGCANVLAARYPGLEDILKIGRAAVNDEFADGSQLLHDADDVAFLPPVSGG